MFAWEAYEHGTDVHTLADPTKLELMHKQFKEKKKNFKSDQQQSILEKVTITATLFSYCCYVTIVWRRGTSRCSP